jgi:hypothetical protein
VTGWRVELGSRVKDGINGLCSSGELSRTGMLLAYNSLWLELPRQARYVQNRRDPIDPDYFLYKVRVRDRGVWHHFTFSVQDKVEGGLLYVADLVHLTSR